MYTHNTAHTHTYIVSPMRALSLSLFHRRCILLTYFIFTIACVDIPKIIYEQSHIHAWMLTRSLAFNTSPTNHTQTHSTLSPNLCQRGVQGEKQVFILFLLITSREQRIEQMGFVVVFARRHLSACLSIDFLSYPPRLAKDGCFVLLGRSLSV